MLPPYSLYFPRRLPTLQRAVVLETPSYSYGGLNNRADAAARVTAKPPSDLRDATLLTTDGRVELLCNGQSSHGPKWHINVLTSGPPNPASPVGTRPRHAGRERETLSTPSDGVTATLGKGLLTDHKDDTRRYSAIAVLVCDRAPGRVNCCCPPV